MSHVATYKTKLGTVNKELFMLAVKEFISSSDKYREHGYIYNYIMNDAREVDIAVQNSEADLSCGVGFKFDEKGNVDVVGDPYNNNKEFNFIKQEVLNLYSGIALELSFIGMGYKTNRTKSDAGEWVVSGYEAASFEEGLA